MVANPQLRLEKKRRWEFCVLQLLPLEYSTKTPQRQRWSKTIRCFGLRFDIWRMEAQFVINLVSCDDRRQLVCCPSDSVQLARIKNPKQSPRHSVQLGFTIRKLTFLFYQHFCRFIPFQISVYCNYNLTVINCNFELTPLFLKMNQLEHAVVGPNQQTWWEISTGNVVVEWILNKWANNSI